MSLKTLVAWMIVIGLCFGSSVIGGKKARNWQTGKLLDSQRSKNLVGAVDHPPVGFDTRRRTTNVFETQDDLVIESNTLTYTVSETVRNGKSAHVTINGPIKFAVEGTVLYFMDESGKEHRTEIVKKVLRQSTAAPK